MAGRFRQPDVSGNDRGEHLAWEMSAHFLRYLRREVRAPIEHGQRHAENLQPGIHTALYRAERCHQVAEPLQREVFALHRHQDSVRCTQGVQRQQLQRRRTIHKNQVIAFLDPVQRHVQLPFPVLGGDQLHGGARQIGRGRQHVPVGRGDDGIRRRNVVDQHVVDRVFALPLVQPQPGGGVCLGVKVAQKHAQSQIMQGGGQIHGGGGFSHAALLIHHGNYFPHSFILYLSEYIPRKTKCFT